MWFAGRVPPSVSPYRPQVAVSAASPPPALSGRPAPDRSPPAHVRHTPLFDHNCILPP